jgi:glucose uptake protein GlcU
MKRISILLLLLFGFAYSVYLSSQGGFFLGLVVSLMAIGLATTIYILDNKGNNKIVIYVWLAIVIIVVGAYISTGVFHTAEIFRNPVKFI